MRIFIIKKYISNKCLISELHKKVQSQITNINIEIREEGQEIDLNELKKVDLLITFDLAGFERSTLANGISYNLLNCKQIHFLLNKNLSNESYLSKQLSLSMFFFCSDNDYYHYLIDTYPDIPYLEPIMSQEKADLGGINVDVLWLSIYKVIKICKLSDAIEEQNGSVAGPN